MTMLLKSPLQENVLACVIIFDIRTWNKQACFAFSKYSFVRRNTRGVKTIRLFKTSEVPPLVRSTIVGPSIDPTGFKGRADAVTSFKIYLQSSILLPAIGQG